LVVVFFMHALVSSRVTWIVIVVACFWLGLLLVLGMTDYFTRPLPTRPTTPPTFVARAGDDRLFHPWAGPVYDRALTRRSPPCV
jgi:hypothetical protein